MKKIISFTLAVVMILSAVFMFAGCVSTEEQIIVHTNAFFAPFEYYDGTEIKGVDVEVMNAVGEKLGKEIVFENVEFSAIIDNVSEGKICDAGAAGITITESRQEKVDFSIPYYTSVQYVIWAEGDDTISTVNGEYVLWDALAGLKVGVQTDTTGAIYTDGEINATADNDYGYDGVLYGTNTVMVNFDNAQLAADAITQAKSIDVVIIDELPAKFITEKNEGLVCLPLYYAGSDGEPDCPTEEQYAICVTKGNDELLAAINAVLEEYTALDENGSNKILDLVMKHMGLED